MKKLIITLCYAIGMGLVSMAQPINNNPKGGSTGPPYPSPGSESVGVGAPIDGGISMLLILGSVMAGRKIYKFKNKINT